MEMGILMLRVIQFLLVFYYRSADTLGSEWRQVVTFSGDSGLLVPGAGYEVLWATGVDLPGADDTVMFRIEPFDANVLKIPTLGTPRLSICIKTESLTPKSTSEHSTLK